MENLNSYFGMGRNDFLFAKASVDLGKELGNYNNTAFICAQAAEKFLKAVIEKAFIEDESSMSLLHSHNLRALFNKIITKYHLTVSSKDCNWLGNFYFDARYPGNDFIVVNEFDAFECLAIAEKIMNDVKAILEVAREESENSKNKLKDLKAF